MGERRQELIFHASGALGFSAGELLLLEQLLALLGDLLAGSDIERGSVELKGRALAVEHRAPAGTHPANLAARRNRAIFNVVGAAAIDAVFNGFSRPLPVIRMQARI